MHVVGQDGPRVAMERGSPARLAHRFAQGVDVRDEEVGTAVEQGDREEVGRSGDPVASVVRHRNTMPEIRP